MKFLAIGKARFNAKKKSGQLKKEKFILGYKYLHNGGGKILQYKQTVGQAKLDLAKTTRENIILLEESNFTGTMDLGPYDSEKGLCREEHHLLKKNRADFKGHLYVTSTYIIAVLGDYFDGYRIQIPSNWKRKITPQELPLEDYTLHSLQTVASKVERTLETILGNT